MSTPCSTWRRLILLLLTGWLCTPVMARDVFFAAVDQLPPFMITRHNVSSDAGVDGIDWELLQELSFRTGVQIYPLHYPLKRALKELKAGRVDLITSLYKTEKRSQYIGYLSTPYYRCHVRFYALRELAQQIRTYDDLYGKRIGYLRGAEYFPRFDADEGLTRQPVNVVSQLPWKLLRHYDQLFVGTDCQVDYMLREMGLLTEIAPTRYDPGHSLDLYVGYSKAAHLDDKLPLLDRALTQLVAEGWVERMAKTYFEPPVQVPAPATPTPP